MAKILVVDDRQINRDLIVSLLGAQGHQILEAVDGHYALDRVSSDRPDLVICDVLMPTMDGYEFVRQLRANPDVAATKVIFWTAHFHEREAKALALAVGVSHVLTKPSEPQDILRVVDEALGARRSEPPSSPVESFTQEQLRVVTEKLSHAVDDLQRANQRLRALIDLSLQLVSQRNPDLLFDEACRGARELIGARYGAAGVRSIETDETIHFVTSGIEPEIVKELGRPVLMAGVLGEVVKERRTARLPFAPRSLKALGLPAAFPAADALLAAPIVSQSTSYGWICLVNKLGVTDFDDQDTQILTILAALVGRSYENGNVYREAKRDASEQMQVLARRLIEAQDFERRQLARELHDRAGQNLTALSINLDVLNALIAGDQRLELHARLKDAMTLVAATTDTLENVMSELHPPLLAEHGLLSALRWYAKEFSQRTGIEITISGDQNASSVPESEAILYRIAQEALNNVAKHAHAKLVRISLSLSGRELTLSIADDGIGYDSRSSSRSGRGIATMKERALAVGGRVELQGAPQKGTLIRIHVPILN